MAGLVAFNVWKRDWPWIKEVLGNTIVVEHRDKAFTFGHCRDSTCRHNSHDPYMEGFEVEIACSSMFQLEYEDELGKRSLSGYQLENGVVFLFDPTKPAYHFARRNEFLFRTGDGWYLPWWKLPAKV